MKRKKTRRYISGMLVAVLLFLLCVVQNVNAEDVPVGSELPRLVDDADILTDSEEKELNQQLDTVSEEQECDVIVVTVDSLNGKTVEEYADDYMMTTAMAMEKITAEFCFWWQWMTGSGIYLQAEMRSRHLQMRGLRIWKTSLYQI